MEHALAQIIQHYHARRATQPAKGLLVQLRPDLRTGSECQQPHGFAAVAQGQHEQAGTTILPAAGVAYQGARSIIHLRLFARRSLYHRAGFRRRLSTETTEEALDALIATGEAAEIDQILPDALGVAALRESQLDGFPEGFAGTAAGG